MRYRQPGWPVLFFLFPWAFAAQSQGPYLVKDIAASESESAAIPKQYLQLGDRTFFVAEDAQHGEEIWITDGSTDGTRIFLDFYPGRKGSDPELLDAADGLIFFVALSPVVGWGLWQSDGELAGTRLLKAFPEASRYYSPMGWLRRLGDRVVFNARVSSADRHALFLLDLVSGEEHLVRLCAAPCRSTAWSPRRVGRTVYFKATTDETGQELWRTDGSLAGTALVADIWPGESDGVDSWPNTMADIDGELYFVARRTIGNWQVWRTDGTAEGTLQLSQIGLEYGSPRSLTPLGDQLYFVTRFGDLCVPWRTDGTPLSARLAPELMPFGTESDARDLLAVDSRMFFTVRRVEHPDTELWVFDAAQDATRFVAVGVNTLLTAPSLPGRAVFFARGGLWVSDGTSSGNQELPISQVRYPLGRVGDHLVFDATDESTGWKLRISDGTIAGTKVLKDTSRSYSNPYLRNFRPFQEHLYFAAGSSVEGQVWRSDGTEIGTEVAEPGIAPRQITATGERLFIIGRDSGEMWSRTATEPAVLLPLEEYVTTWNFAPIDSLLYFSTWPWGQTLWRSDGTVDGTVELLNLHPDWYNDCVSICPSDHQVFPALVQTVGDLVFFVVTDEEHQHFELWRSDGTIAGTRAIYPFDFGPGDDWKFIYDSEAAALDPEHLILSFLSPTGPRLLLSDALEARLQPEALPGVSARRLVPSEGRVYFILRDESSSDHLWITDGSALGTRQVHALPAGALVGEMVAVGRRAFLSVYQPTTGAELWVSDGTGRGTHQVTDTFPGHLGSEPVELTAVEDRLVFAASDGESGQEPWISDGTEAGTRRIADLDPGVAASGPSRFTAVGDTVFFIADDGVHGRELFAFDVEEVATTVFADGFESGDTSSWHGP